MFCQRQGYPTGTATELENSGACVRNARNIERQIGQRLAIEVVEPCNGRSRVSHGALIVPNSKSCPLVVSRGTSLTWPPTTRHRPSFSRAQMRV